jgi:hypothetical protein
MGDGVGHGKIVAYTVRRWRARVWVFGTATKPHKTLSRSHDMTQRLLGGKPADEKQRGDGDRRRQ